MVRGLAQHLRPLLAGANSFLSGQAVAQYAVPAIAVPKAGGLFGGSKRITVPLSEPLPGVNLPNPSSPKAPELQVSSVQTVQQRWSPMHCWLRVMLVQESAGRRGCR